MPDAIAEIRIQDDLIEALRAAKNMRGLSNEWCDLTGDMAKGQTDKCLGPSRLKGLSRFLFGMYLRQFAVKLVLVPDTDMERIMRPKWEGRDIKNVRVDAGRISKTLLDRARPYVLRELGQNGARARWGKQRKKTVEIESAAPQEQPIPINRAPKTKRHTEGKHDKPKGSIACPSPLLP
ncbi:MAG: hypothetical protein H0V72_29380 [Bradyrhizobium sp.]|nr:hypothetical protein [Bradyrhizobium sp.]